MATYECNACGGVYTDPQPDGSRYFHACAPVHNPEFDAQFTTDENGNLVPITPIDPTIPPMLEHEEKRDENVEVKPDGEVGAIEDGAGKDPVK